MIWLAMVLLALFVGYFIGTRRERGTWQRIRRIEEMQAEERKAKRGVKLSTISFRR